MSYLHEFLKPLLAAFLPCALILIQLACWFDARPFQVGEPVLLEVQLRDGTPLDEHPALLTTSESLLVETDALRIPSKGELDWRLRARTEDRGWVDVAIAGVTERKQIAIGDRLRKLSVSRRAAGFWNELTHPSEAPLDPDSPIRRIDVRYPARQLFIDDYEIHWLVAFFVLTIAFSLLFQRAFRVSF